MMMPVTPVYTSDFQEGRISPLIGPSLVASTSRFLHLQREWSDFQTTAVAPSGLGSTSETFGRQRVHLHAFPPFQARQGSLSAPESRQVSEPQLTKCTNLVLRVV
jgi:hypothetical protein